MEEFTDLNELVRRYRRGELSDADICRMIFEGKLSTLDAALVMGRNESEVMDICRRVREAPEVFEEAEHARSRPVPVSRGRGGAVLGGVESPTVTVLSQLAAQSAEHAVRYIQFWSELGRSIFNFAYFYAATHPRYSERLKSDPMTTVKQFAMDALDFYVRHLEIVERYRELLARALHLLERYRQIVKELEPYARGAAELEAEYRLLVYLVDRMLMARLLGIDTSRLRRLARSIARRLVEGVVSHALWS